MSLHSLVKCTCQKWHQSEICIVINDKAQGRIAKHLRCDYLLYYTFITQYAGERIFKIGEHLAKLHTVKNFRIYIRIFFRKVGRRSSVIIFPSIYGNMCNILYVLTERFPLVNEIS